MEDKNWLPVRRHWLVLLLTLLAGCSLVVSSIVNLHSVAWLAGLYVSVISFCAALRDSRSSPLRRAFAVYTAMLAQYFLIVWFLHMTLPGSDPAQTGRYVNSMARILCLGSIYMPVAIYYFTLRFADVRHWALKWLEYVGWAGASAFYISNLAGRYYTGHHWAGYTWVPDMDGDYRYFFYFTSFYVTLGLVVPIIKFFASRSRQRRLQLFYYLLGGVPLWLACWGNFLISIGINIYPAGGVIFFMHALIVAYAVFRERVYDVTFVLRRGLAYALFSTVIGLVYCAAVLIISRGGVPSRSQTLLSGALFVVFTALVASPLFEYLKGAVDRIFFRNSSNRQKEMERFARESAATIDLDSLARALCSLVDRSLNPRRASLYLDDGKGALVHFCSQDGQYTPGQWPGGTPLPPEYSTTNGLGYAVRRIQAPQRIQDQQPLQLTEGNDALIVPIVHRDRQLGCLLLEPKRADEPYDDDDMRLAEMIADQSAVALQNARSFAQLDHLQKLTQTMLGSLPTGVLVVSSRQRIIQSNKAAHSICSIDGTFPLNVGQLQEMQPLLGTKIHSLVENGEPQDDIELKIDEPRSRNVLLSFRQLGPRDDENLFLVILHDITNYKELESVASRRESLARIGEAAAGINHEIRNLLHPIRFQMDRLAKVNVDNAIDVRSEVERATTIIPEQVRALEKMLSNLKNLGRPIQLRIGIVDLESLVNAVWREVSTRPIAVGISFSLVLSEDAKEVCADGAWLRQVIHNLLLNASEATGGCDHPRVSLQTQRKDRVFSIKVCDNGRGIDEAARKRLFEPFFSTKGEAGTGLGLCVCRRIVESHGGQIAVEFSNGQTVFVITLPQPADTTSFGDPLSSPRE